MIETRFSFDDQIDFANFSGDYNPIHCDPVAARRFMQGQVIVHGIHLLMYTLNQVWGNFETKMRIKFLDVSFKSPVFLDKTIFLHIENNEEFNYTIQLKGKNNTHALINLGFEESKRGRKFELIDKKLDRREPVKLVDSDMLNRESAIPLVIQKEILKRMFPILFEKADIHQLSVLLASTVMVGMECPGYNSIYANLKLHATDLYDVRNCLNYKVDKFDKRFGITNINITAPGISGTVLAFLRPSPQPQISFEEIKREHESSQLFGRHVLIVGGSRGIGEISAKFFAAKGAKVTIT